jgi:hypothetical protein
MKHVRVFRNAERTFNVRLEGANRNHSRQFKSEQYEHDDKYERNYSGQSFELPIQEVGLAVKIQRGRD